MTADADPGHGSTGSGPARGRDFGDFVRLALNAAADQIEPCTDGLSPDPGEDPGPGRRSLAAGVRHEQILAGPEVNAARRGGKADQARSASMASSGRPARHLPRHRNETDLLWAV